MAKIKSANKSVFHSGLIKRLKVNRNQSINLFAQHFFADLSMADLNQRHWEDVVASVQSCWKFYSNFDGEKAKIRIIPENSNLLVIEIASSNLPFLMDSIRMELNQLGLVLADVQQCLMSVSRIGRRFKIQDVGEPNESLIRLEVSAVTFPDDLSERLMRVLDLVDLVVEDFEPMCDQLLRCSEDASRVPGGYEASEFLKWAFDNNFVLLGYEEWSADGAGSLKRVPRARLGLAKPKKSADRIPLNIPDGIIDIERLPVKSKIHRPVYLESFTLCIRKGKRVTRVCRFMGLLTSAAYNQHPTELPVVRQKMGRIFAESGFVTTSHKGSELSHIFVMLPREELFFSPVEDLKYIVMEIFALQERELVRVFARQDRFFTSCYVYIPKEKYNTALRLRIQEILVRAFDADDVEFSTYFSGSVLTRTHFLLQTNKQKRVDLGAIEVELTALIRSWTEELQKLVRKQYEPDEAARINAAYKGTFPPGYRAHFPITSALDDLRHIEELSVADSLSLKFYEEDDASVRFKIFHLGGALPLSDVIPILENLGVKTIEEHPYELVLNGSGGKVWIHDFLLVFFTAPEAGIGSLQGIFEEAFKAIWRSGSENDAFNRLVPTATMNYRQVSVIRAYARYLGQLQNSSGQRFIAECVSRYADITKLLFMLFEQRFDPASLTKSRRTTRSTSTLQEKILVRIADDVVNLSDDRILRSYVEMIMATQRTNFFQLTDGGETKDYISLKLLPELIAEVPEPKPKFEIFVYSPRFEGVHLRGGKIARGGLRWSDRTEDYRTEILGLVKAQQVKNSVIVPVGAKGGFLPKLIPENASRDEIMAEGIACYRLFIQGLLDVTDNLVKGEVVRPANVVCHDEEDYYLVVAADKGTATFSDIANEISESNGFWLGDAFASGGSVGYDHKAMGITAKGAWKSVQQHFRDMGTDIQSNDFSVVGIGDMSGDVFGNGMLLSEHICLIAAFNHLHIFVDPNPSSRRSFTERRRLFRQPRSSWSDYNQKLLSKGGGVFSRSAKSIKISPEMKQRFGISQNSLTPNRLIAAILVADADLLWNGGIGTYVKARGESHLDVADKANDSIRIDAHELKCKVVGEGGNLGLTQLARIEFCLNGGTCFTDFIDNAGGVNCSDAEVNIKILLNQLLETGALTRATRKTLLRKMTDDVSKIVLDNNYRQAQAIKLMDFQTERRGGEYAGVLKTLEDEGKLDRELEFLPSDEEILERQNKGQYLTAPELSVLTSYVKGVLKEELSASEVVNESYLKEEMMAAFPAHLVTRYGPMLASHRLCKELVATQIANGIVNYMGINFVSRLKSSAGVSTEKIARCFIAARDIFDLPGFWQQASQLDYKIDHAVQKEMMIDAVRLVRRTTRWLIRNRRRSLILEEEIPRFQQVYELLLANLENLLTGNELSHWQEKRHYFLSKGVPESLANFAAAAHHLYAVMGIVEATLRTGQRAERIAEIYFSLGEVLQLNWFSRRLHEYQAESRWQALARETLQNDLHWQQVALTLNIVSEIGKSKPARTAIDQWIVRHQGQVDRWMELQSQMKLSSIQDTAVYSVGIRELLDLAQLSAVNVKR